MKISAFPRTALVVAAVHASFGCSTDHSKDHAAEATPGAPHEHAKAEAHAHAAAEIELSSNDGPKWELDAHTREFMAKIVAAVDAAPTAGPPDAAALGSRLDELTQQLIQGCTMTGPAHDQLHVFLTKWLPAVTRLKTADATGADAAVAEIRALLAAFEQHFT